MMLLGPPSLLNNGHSGLLPRGESGKKLNVSTYSAPNVCFVLFLKYTDFIPLNRMITRVVFVKETQCVFYTVQTEILTTS
jgi:hypothetical protein